MRYPDWFKAQLIEATTVRGLSYIRAAQLYGVGEDTIRSWVKAAADAPVGLDRVEALEYRVARIEHYLALAEAIREQHHDHARPACQTRRDNGHNGIGGRSGPAGNVLSGHRAERVPSRP